MDEASECPKAAVSTLMVLVSHPLLQVALASFFILVFLHLVFPYHDGRSERGP